MGDTFMKNCKERFPSGRKMKLDGTKWEYPIPKSKEYWEKFCDDEEKKLLVVRDPFLELSYRSFPNNDTAFDCFQYGSKESSDSSFSNSNVDGSKTSKSSLRETSALKSKFNLNEDHNNGTKLFPKSILKAPSRAFPKSSGAACNLGATTKVTRIPKLEVSGSQPSFARIPDQPETERDSFSTLPALSAPLRSKIPTSPEKDKKESRRAANEDYLKYSIRCAYKALKQLRGNKKLNYERKTIRRSSGSLFGASSTSGRDDEQRSLLESSIKKREDDVEEPSSPPFRRMEAKKSSLRESQFGKIDIEGTLNSEETMSKTIPTGSRFTSGSSPEFVYPDDTREGHPSTRILSSIPKFSGFPRRNRDRCLSCMYKSFERPSPRKISFPLTLFRRALSPRRTRTPSASGSSENTDSSSNFENLLERISSGEVRGKGVTFEEFDDSESLIVKESTSVAEKRRDRAVVAVENVRDSDGTVTKKDKGDESTAKNRDEGTSSIRVASFEQARISSLHDESSDEEDSFAVSVGDDQSTPMCLAPCHAPTVLKPSLEPLRALRNRKPTTLQDRIDFYEAASMKKSVSADDYDYEEKPRSEDGLNKITAGQKAGRASPRAGGALRRAKSVTEKLTLGNLEPVAKKEQHVLRKGTSLSSFVLEDTAANVSEISRDASKGALRKLNSTLADGSSKTMTNFSSNLPLTRPDRVAEILLNLERSSSSSTSVLDALCKEFLDCLSGDEHIDAKKRNEIGRLTRLLVDSKRYLCPDKFPSDLLFSSNQPPTCNPRILRKILPQKSYNLVAPLLGLPEWHTKKGTSFQDTKRGGDRRCSMDETVASDDETKTSLLMYITKLSYEFVDEFVYRQQTCRYDAALTKNHQGISEKLLTRESTNSLEGGEMTKSDVHPATPRHVESVSDEEKLGQRRYNPYALFLTRPRREVIRWRNLKENDLEGYDPDATLKMRADNMMKKICHEFCQWVDSLGGTDKTIDEEVLRDMFEIDFNGEICRALQISIEEMPVVPTEVALTRNSPGASKLAMTRKHVIKDAKAEQRAAKTKAFGTTIPWKFQFVPPNNQVQRKWLQCENVPQDLETMEAVWKDITHLKSVRGFVEWLQQHPEVPPPDALKTIVSMDIEALRQIEDDEAFAHLELDINQIRSLRVGDSGDAIA